MIKPELYKKTVDILFDAYFNDELRHGECSACAVGNICKGNGVPVYNHLMYNAYNNAAWRNVFSTSDSWGQIVDEHFYVGEAKRVIDATGYTWQELAKIEYAFESAPKGNSEEDWMFNGLVAVLEVLKQIHQVEDNEPEVTRFKNHYQTLTA